jgi:hypothetical protein
MNRPARARGPVTHKDQVLARRRLALIGLGTLVPVTLVAALVTGSRLLLIINVIVDLVVGGYVAMLLQIKQTQQMAPRWGGGGDDEDIRVVSR